MNPAYIVSIVCFAFCLFIFFYIKWYIKRRTSVSELLAEYRTEVYRLIAEIDSVTDRDSQLVEERIKKLNSILDETEKRIAVYVRELERSRSGEALYTSLGRGIRAALKTPAESESGTETALSPPSALSQHEQQLSQLASLAQKQPVSAPAQTSVQNSAPKLSIVKSRASAEGASTEAAQQQLSLEPMPSAPQHAPSKKQIRSEIEKLVNQGVSAGDIASLLDISLSEVDLAIILLSRQKK